MSEEIRDPDAVLAALNRAKEEAKTYREQLEGMQATVNELRTEVETYRTELTETALRRAITKEGVDPDRVMRYLNRDAFKLDADGNLEGFDDELARVKEELPELFDTKRRVGGAVEMFPKGDVKVEKSVSQLQAERLLQH